MNNKYYLWISVDKKNWQATGNLHGYDTKELLKSDTANQLAMSTYYWCIMKSIPIEYSVHRNITNKIEKQTITGD